MSRLTGTYRASAEDIGARIDAVLARVAPAPRSLVTRAIEAGDVARNGVVVLRPSTRLEEGDELVYTIPERAELSVEPEAIALTIVHEDEDVLVVDKPAGMVTHPAHGTLDGTLVNALLAHLPDLPGERVRAGLVHRLDRDTSGLLLIAKTPAALTTLGKAMQKRYIERTYLGLVVGIPADPAGTIDGPIGRDAGNRLKYAIRTDGKHAVTHYAVRERLHHAAELEFTLETGRTHQIRVHLAAIGHPVVNDPVYGRNDSRFSLPGQALHAWRLAFKHPRTREPLAFEVDPPLEYVEAKELLRTP